MDLIGLKFGKLLVIEKTNEKAKNNKEYKYRCLCDCGNEVLVRGSNLKSGNSKTCGCVRIKNSTAMSKSYRKRNIRIYNIYQNMKQRCYNPNYREYKHYGGKGVVICDEWLNDYVKFYNWALENGYRDDLSIDRINNNGIYEPSNCSRFSSSNNNRNNYSN